MACSKDTRLLDENALEPALEQMPDVSVSPVKPDGVTDPEPLHHRREIGRGQLQQQEDQITDLSHSFFSPHATKRTTSKPIFVLTTACFASQLCVMSENKKQFSLTGVSLKSSFLSVTLFTAVLLLLLLFLGGINVAQGDDKPTSNDLGKIQPPGGVPLVPGGAGNVITADAVRKMSKRLEAAPAEDRAKWVVELERITDKKLDSEIEEAACFTHFVTRVSVAFDDLKWNAKVADDLFKRAQAMPAAEAEVWKEAFESLLKKETRQAYAVPLVLIPVEALHEGQKYSAERGKKYLARMKQLTAGDISLWKDKADEFWGTELDAVVNIILLDDYFDEEKFQRGKFEAAISTRKKGSMVESVGQNGTPQGQAGERWRRLSSPKLASPPVATRNGLACLPLGSEECCIQCGPVVEVLPNEDVACVLPPF
jgi:hypothetical protein